MMTNVCIRLFFNGVSMNDYMDNCKHPGYFVNKKIINVHTCSIIKYPASYFTKIVMLF